MKGISYVIKDKETGNFCSENSFVTNSDGTKVLYITCSGNNKERPVTTYTIDRVEKVLNKLQTINNRLQANKMWYITEIFEIPLGQIIIENIKG